MELELTALNKKSNKENMYALHQRSKLMWMLTQRQY